MVNLLGNAVKFTETGGIRLTVKRHEEQLIFLVSDSGKGIEIQQQSQIFTAFYQADTNSQGTGIGLTIASSPAKMMGGNLTLKSVPGVGTCVSLVLPLQEYQPPQPIKGTLSAPFCLAIGNWLAGEYAVNHPTSKMRFSTQSFCISPENSTTGATVNIVYTKYASNK